MLIGIAIIGGERCNKVRFRSKFRRHERSKDCKNKSKWDRIRYKEREQGLKIELDATWTNEEITWIDNLDNGITRQGIELSRQRNKSITNRKRKVRSNRQKMKTDFCKPHMKIDVVPFNRLIKTNVAFYLLACFYLPNNSLYKDLKSRILLGVLLKR